MNKQPSIFFLIPYFGHWPFWMPFFVESCRGNPSVDWLLVGDCAPLDNLPPNVKQRHISFADYCTWISERLGFAFAPKSPYKLCDLKPALGYLHEQDVAGHDYWGFSDLDLIYGNLRAYFSDERLRRYKFFSTHERRVSGHLCLLRNEKPLRELFREIPDFQRRVQDQKNHALDEGAFTRLFLWRKNFPKPLFKLVGKFNRWRRVARFKEAFSTPNGVRAWTDGTQDYPEYWTWAPGSLTNAKDGAREFPYLHFLVWKKQWHKQGEPLLTLEQAQALASSQSWHVDRKGFHPGATP
jgi:hypothetical protein